MFKREKSFYLVEVNYWRNWVGCNQKFCSNEHESVCLESLGYQLYKDS